MNTYRRLSFFLGFWSFICFLCSGCCHRNTLSNRPSTQLSVDNAPRIEFRGVWVASVDNTDWPSQPGLSTEQQQAELCTLLDRAADLHLNAILFQVRPSCDAMYQSSIEPWSVFLTGHAGIAPKPFYDPLAFVITEAHRRGMQLHAWVNPFRVRTKSDKSYPAANGIERSHPQWVREYGDLKWLDPGEPQAREYSLAVLADIVKRYDVDGIHIDDYFYPYPQTVSASDPKSPVIPFPDEASFARFGNGASLSDWRRGNINDFVHRLYDQTKSIKPAVQVGISPFGIWRPGYPAQIVGFDSYEKLYADSRLWLQQGWADYFTPQLYWPIDRTAVSFPVLLNWWQEQNTKGRRIWPGLNVASKNANPAEIEYQIRTARGFGCDGHILFSAAPLLLPKSSGEPSPQLPGNLFDHLGQTVYRGPAVIPSSN